MVRIDLANVVTSGVYKASELAFELEKLLKDLKEIARIEKTQPINLTITMLTTTAIDSNGIKQKASSWKVNLYTDVIELTQSELMRYAEERAKKLLDDSGLGG